MNQLDLLSPVAAGHARAAKAAAHAERVDTSWGERALGYVRLHALVNPYFRTEQVRLMAEADGFDPPPDKRAWGHVMKRAERAGIIAAAGYETDLFGSPKTRWRSLHAKQA
jgi:hypothetical protein